MTTDPRVSVFLPTYNQVAFIGHSIESALEQDYANLHVVVGDDGSTDGTADVVSSYASRFPDRLTAIVGEQHLGITGNSNRTLALCTGEYIAFSAGDDGFLPGKISRQVSWLEADPERVICGHDVHIIDDEGAVQGLWSQRSPLPAGRGASRLVQRTSLYPGASLMLRASARPPQGYDSRLPIVSDWLFFIDCLADDGIYGYIDGVWAQYRRHPGNISVLDPAKVARRTQIRSDLLLTLALVEARYPHLLGAVRRARAAVLCEEGAWCLWRRDLKTARRYFFASLLYWPLYSWQVPAGLVAASTPEPLLRLGLTLAERYRTRF